MSLVPLLPLFHSFNREYFENALTVDSRPLVTLKWSDGRLRKTAGLYRSSKNMLGLKSAEIVLSRPLLEYLPTSAIESTLCHEMIHAWVDLVLHKNEGHGPHFYARMNAINSVQDKFQISVRHKFPVPITPPRWWAVCPSCGLRLPYRRIVRNAACRHCCNIHHGGSWHASCLLKYEPVVEKD